MSGAGGFPHPAHFFPHVEISLQERRRFVSKSMSTTGTNPLTLCTQEGEIG